MKFKKKEKQKNKKELPTIKIGTHKRGIIALWILLVVSLLFGIYKNFTAIDKHTIHEKEIIEKYIIDTNKVESFVSEFASIYYSWEQSQKEIDNRNEKLKQYLSEDLQILNADMIRTDIPTKAIAGNIQIWSVEQLESNNYKVLFSVSQQITENNISKSVKSTYHVIVYMDKKENMIILQNPTMDAQPMKSNFKSKAEENDSTVDINMSEEISDFLTTFFTLYPKANAKELSYYVENDVLNPVNKDYIFVELIDPVYKMKDNQIVAIVTVKYLDQETKTIQLSQFKFNLEKKNNWRIIK